MEIRAPFRRARPDDVDVLLELVNYAGDGLARYLWEQWADEGETPEDFGRRRALREEGGFSFRNTFVIEHEGDAVGCLVGYEIPDAPVPIADDMPAMFVPLQELENLAPGTWYMNLLAVQPAARGRGLGTALIALAEEIAISLDKSGTSLIVSDANTDARRLYERCGYAEVATRPMVKEGWQHAGENWVLLKK